jgi:hypothetical protein
MGVGFSYCSARAERVATVYSLILTLVCSSALPAQVARISGQVIDARGPVSAAELRLQRDAGAVDAEHPSARSDSLGHFSFTGVALGRWVLSIRKLGYAPFTDSIALTGDTVLTIHLDSAAQALAPVLVRDDRGVPARYGTSSRLHEFYIRRDRGVGHFLAREDLERLIGGRLSDALRTVAGARVRIAINGDVTLNFARCAGSRLSTAAGSGNLQSLSHPRQPDSTSNVALYVDGMRVTDGMASEMMGALRLKEIEAVEIYRGPTELPPIAVGSACAAVFVWMRFGADSTARR